VGFIFLKMTQNDLPFFLSIRNECRKYLHNNNYFSLEECKKWFISSTTKYYIVTMNNNKIGYIRLSEHDKLNKSIYIGADLHKNYRGRGIGKKLYDNLFSFLKENFDIKILYLEVLSHNLRAINLYINLGFRPLNLIQNFDIRDGIHVNSIKMYHEI